MVLFLELSLFIVSVRQCSISAMLHASSMAAMSYFPYGHHLIMLSFPFNVCTCGSQVSPHFSCPYAALQF